MSFGDHWKGIVVASVFSCLATSAFASAFRTEVSGVSTGAGSVTIIIEDFTSPSAAPYPVSFNIPTGSTAAQSTSVMSMAMKEQLPGQFSITQHTNCVTVEGPIETMQVVVETVPGQAFVASPGPCPTPVLTRAPAATPFFLALLAAALTVLGLRRVRPHRA